MGILIINSDFERIWNEPMPSISFDNTSYSLAGEVGTELSASFAIFDNYDADVTEQCEITFDNDYVSIEEGMFVCEDLEVGTYQTIATATYSYKSATVTATATINIAVQEQQPTSISFNSSTYSMSGNEDEALTQAFSVSDDLNNDITTLCSYSFSPNDKGLYADGGYFKVDSAIAGTYSITVTATYGELTNTATISMSVVDLPNSISFDSATYTITGTEYDTIQQQFAVTDDLNNDVTMDCSYSFSPNDTDLVVSDVGGEYYAFDASSVSAGTYSVTVTATYAARNLTATATISMDIASAVHDYSKDYLTFEALESGTFTFGDAIDYSVDGGTTWTTLAANTASPTIAQGDKVLWRGTLQNTSKTFSATGRFNVAGNVMSIYCGDNFVGQTSFPLYGCDKLFYSNKKLVSAKNLVLPATTLPATCYQQMFSACSTMTEAPALLPAVTLSNSCYRSMFSGCASLTTAPALNATTLGQYCCYQMFENCTSLTTAPALNATTLVKECYDGMFSGCTSLTTAPELPALTLAERCYNGMFYGCSSLNSVKILATNVSANYCLNYWLDGVAATGTVICEMNPDTNLPYLPLNSVSGIPTDWTYLTPVQ